MRKKRCKWKTFLKISSNVEYKEVWSEKKPFLNHLPMVVVEATAIKVDYREREMCREDCPN